MNCIKTSLKNFPNKISKSFAYQPKIKFLGPRRLLPHPPIPNTPNTTPILKTERKLQDISEYKHEFSSFSRKPIEDDEIEVINSGGNTFNWRKVKKIKIVKFDDDD